MAATLRVATLVETSQYVYHKFSCTKALALTLCLQYITLECTFVNVESLYLQLRTDQATVHALSISADILGMALVNRND